MAARTCQAMFRYQHPVLVYYYLLTSPKPVLLPLLIINTSEACKTINASTLAKKTVERTDRPTDRTTVVDKKNSRGKHGKKTATTTATTSSTASALTASRVWRRRKKKRRKSTIPSSVTSSSSTLSSKTRQARTNSSPKISLNGECGREDPENSPKYQESQHNNSYNKRHGQHKEHSQNVRSSPGLLGLLLLTVEIVHALLFSLYQRYLRRLPLWHCLFGNYTLTKLVKTNQKVSWTCVTHSQRVGSSRMVIWPALLLVSGLVHLPAVSAQTLTTSSKPSGPLCGSANPATQCILSSTCLLTGVCQCPAGFYGEGNFHCYSEARARTQVTGPGNTLVTLANTSADLLWPCRSRFTEVKTTRASDGNTCHFQVFALNKIIGGRVASAGIEVHFQVEGDSTIPNGIGIRKEGLADHGVFTFAEWGRDAFELEDAVTESDPNYSPDSMDTESDGSGSGDSATMTFMDDDEGDNDDWGHPEQLGIGSGQVVKATLDNDNFAVVDVPDCGVDIRFRPPNTQASQQTQSPGIALSVDASNSPVFQDEDTYLSESPTTNSLSSQANQNGQTTTLEALHRSMMFAAKQPSTPLGEECAKTSFLYRSTCSSQSDRLQALASCSFFLSEPDLVGCMDTETDGTSYQSLNAFRLCLWNTCTLNSNVCLLLKAKVEDRGCMAYTPTAFQSMPCTASA